MIAGAETEREASALRKPRGTWLSAAFSSARRSAVALLLATRTRVASMISTRRVGIRTPSIIREFPRLFTEQRQVLPGGGPEFLEGIAAHAANKSPHGSQCRGASSGFAIGAPGVGKE